VIFRLRKVNNNVANKGRKVKAINPKSHGERNVSPCLNSRLAKGERLLKDLKDGSDFRKSENCSSIGYFLSLIEDNWAGKL
jgi:hypothetical protein